MWAKSTQFILFESAAMQVNRFGIRYSWEMKMKDWSQLSVTCIELTEFWSCVFSSTDKIYESLESANGTNSNS